MNVHQLSARWESDGPMTFATSHPGCIDLVCGTRYADVAVRLEVHDEEPSEPAGYEDCDEVPWCGVDEGPIVVAGFDYDQPVASLDLSGIDPTRVRVCASGRYRFGYEHASEGLPPERWVLQFWPDVDGPDEVYRRPRRLGGPPVFSLRSSSAWLTAMHAWRGAGWPALLGSIRSVIWLRVPLFREQRPLTAEELSVAGDTSGALAPGDAELLVPAFGAVDSWGSLIEAMHRVGLLALVPTVDGPAYLPNPAPPPAWSVVEMDDRRVEHLKRRAKIEVYGTYVPDIEQLVRWSPRPFTPTPRMIAVRLALPVEDIVETLGLVDLTDPGRVQGNLDNLDSPVTVTPKSHPAKR